MNCHLCNAPLVQADGFWCCPTHTLSVIIDGVVLYRALPKQWEAHMVTARWLLKGGAAGGAKSHFLRWDDILACLEAPGLPVLLLRRTLKELENTHILNASGTGFSQLPPSLGTWEKQAKRFVFTNGSYIQCGYCDNDADFAQYLSTEWGRISVDEASQFTPWQITMLNTRLRLPSTMPYRVQMRLASNPGGPLHQFLRERFVDGTGPTDGTPYEPDQYRFIPARVTDNPYQTPEYIEELLKLPAQEKAMYYDGTWDLPMGNLFAELTTDAHHNIDPIPWPRSRKVVCADWGWSAPAPALWVETDQGLLDAPYSRVYREWVPTQTVPAEWARQVVEKSTPDPNAPPEIEAVILDAAAFDPRQDGGPSMAEQMLPVFRQAGIRLLESVKGPGSIDRGIQLLHTYFWTAEGKLKPLLTVSSQCPQTWNALVTIQRGDATKGQDVDLPAPRSPQLHIVDALRYWAASRPRPAELTVEERMARDAQARQLDTDPASVALLYKAREVEARKAGKAIPPHAPPVKQQRHPWVRR